MMTSLFRKILLLTPAVGLVAATSRPVLAGVPVAGVTLTLDDPFPTLVIPSSGSFTHTFTGTVSFTPGLAWDESALFYPFINGALPGIQTGANINVPYPGAENGGIFSGGLFTFEISSTDLPGVYNEAFGGGPATLNVWATDGTTRYSDTVSYTITLVSSPTSVPESSPIGVASVLLGIVAAARCYQRRK